HHLPARGGIPRRTQLFGQSFCSWEMFAGTSVSAQLFCSWEIPHRLHRIFFWSAKTTSLQTDMSDISKQAVDNTDPNEALSAAATIGVTESLPTVLADTFAKKKRALEPNYQLAKVS